MDALMLIADGVEDDTRLSNALYRIRNSLDDNLARAKEKHGEIFECLWSYVYGERREALPEAAQP